MAENLIDLADRLFFKSAEGQRIIHEIVRFQKKSHVYSTEFKRYCEADLNIETGELELTKKY